MPLELDFAQSASDLFTQANKAPASEVDVSDLKTSDLVDYGSDAAKAELDKRIKNLENDYKSQLQTVLKFGSTGATVGSFFGIPVGSAIGAGVGLAVGAVLVFWDDVKGWFGGDTGLSADVREQIYAPVRAITAAHFSTDPRSWPETAARAGAYASFLDDFVNKYADGMDKGDIEDWHDWIQHLKNVQARMRERIETHQQARRVSSGDRVQDFISQLAATAPGLLDVSGRQQAERARNARAALRAAHATLAHLSVGAPAARELVTRLHESAHVDVSAAKATQILRIAATLPAPAWRFI